ncbi:Periplasmic aromatic aldehyde oxidoreductase, FAD binding subunit YagS [Acidisarcina polymorpha]|uniref:Periplasmic aromatic aldehyde oxidoreductase, FAD binding subunit YagS n=1 Tax=Acidisarcina polymorpha TaxID=2211140 RepID=A0A2Z5GAK0_9BACT|nr:xanthine dehydrogenase family protein subunit M [Acidisarcina polymorpha]AXC15625.1 Periplasmic aromatic aldehyde oxidoreductase, FAD binding subunit YagS [Acidisarcina polymorpha]
MRHFRYVKATDIKEAIAMMLSEPEAALLAGGTNLLDLMKYDVSTPTLVIDINGLPLREIRETPEGGLRIGALATNADVAYDERISARYPLLSSAILAGASGQLRNMATIGGNLLQRTRCSYFYDIQIPCNKRKPGSGCPAKTGLNRGHAILGASELCIATHPSDMCVALAAIDAVVIVEGLRGTRAVAFSDFHRLPGEIPQLDTNLLHDEIIVAIDLPPISAQIGHSYLKIRDRLSYAFALVSVAALVKVDDGVITRAALSVGGVAHKPWRDREAETLLVGANAERSVFGQFADRLLHTAVAEEHNGFKIELAHRTVVRCLEQAAAQTPQSQSDKRIR